MSKRRTPALPSSVWSALGPVPVVMVKKLRTKKKGKLMGLWSPLSRTIYIRAGMHPKATLATLAHEWIHVVLWDAGVSLSKRDEESVCDALSVGVIADLMSRTP
jgi:Zn-dependent peptidase ImmA (M78 family)